MDNLIDESKSILSLYTRRHDTIWALYSGGKDSVTAAHIASQMPNFGGVIHIRTDTGPLADEESDRAVTLAKSYGWDVIEKVPFTKFQMLVIEFGFPGPPSHKFMFQYLKERPIRAAKKVAKKRSGKSIMFATGIRRFESVRRENAPEASKIDGEWWVSPLINWTTANVLEYVNQHNLEYIDTRECLCGAFAKPGEREEIRRFHDGQAAYFDWLERIVQETHQYDPAKFEAFRCSWGHGIGSSPDQPIEMDGMEDILCSTCSDFTDLDEEFIARKLVTKP